MHVRKTLFLLVFAGIAASLAAETIAVAVRERSEAEDAPRLASFVEQAVMERLFQSGHIVFDLEIDPEAEAFDYRAIVEAEFGGAATVIVVELELDQSRGDLQMPGRVEVEYFDARSEEVLASFAVSAATVPRYRELTADLLAEQLGDLAATQALETQGGDSGW